MGNRMPHLPQGHVYLRLWDAKQKQLFAARDRFGEKPFYYFRRRGTFLFATEMKALFASGLVPAEPNLSTIYRYLAYREINASAETFFRDVAALPPAHALRYSPGSDSLKSWQYWDIDPEARIRYQDVAPYSELFLRLLNDSVKLRLRSDVAVGSCLSGGLDSSTIVSLIASQRRGNRQVTFSARSGARAATNIWLAIRTHAALILRTSCRIPDGFGRSLSATLRACQFRKRSRPPSATGRATSNPNHVRFPFHPRRFRAICFQPAHHCSLSFRQFRTQ
jgi:asparagine synthetase B (glutamine-hydrolysing)